MSHYLQRQTSLSQPAPGKKGLAERLRMHLRGASGDRCLLLDVSGSMDARDLGGVDRRSRWEAMLDEVREFDGIERVFWFSANCQEVGRLGDVPYPQSMTYMAEAFDHLKAQGIKHAVLVTDGRPDDEDAALQSASGLKLDIVYIGPPPAPKLLSRLAQATGGQYGTAALKERGQLGGQVHLLLTTTAQTPGAINL